MPDRYPLAALIILDGWGLAPESAGNAVSQARTPVVDRMLAEWPSTTLTAHGERVGLPAGTMGNSEVGHLNLGAGRPVYQDLSRIDRAIADGSFARSQALLEALEASPEGRPVHLLALISDGAVHSSLRHLEALIELAAARGLRGEQLLIHGFTDGRDTAPDAGLRYLERLQACCQRCGVGRVATLVGRYLAMDRDHRWERTGQAYRALVAGEGHRCADPAAELQRQYAAGISDEFVEPAVVEGTARIASGDSCLFFNFRADRARQLSRALVGMELPGAESFDRAGLDAVRLTTLTRYEEALELPVVFPPADVSDTLGDAVAAAGLPQLRMAETEKYAHVTYFLNGGREQPLEGEERVLVPSPKVATYDLAPAMSAAALTDAAIARIEAGQRGLLVLNYANPDMVGHTGVLEAVIAAVETVDTQLGRLLAALEAARAAAIVTADHGNAEQMLDPASGHPHTAHTTNPVPLALVAPGDRDAHMIDDGALGHVAPTLLRLLGIAPPDPMGPSLFHV